MIDRREILDIASTLGLLPQVVEKDYVLGWVLAGIYQHAALAENWIFKGGTCLKKCYFETYRFSEDLDFTLTDSSRIDQEFLVSVQDSARSANGSMSRLASRSQKSCRNSSSFQTRVARCPAKANSATGDRSLRAQAAYRVSSLT